MTALGVCRTLHRAGIPNFLINAEDDFVGRSRWVTRLDLPVADSTDSAALASLLSGLDQERAVLMPCSDRWSNAVSDLPPEMKARFPASVSQGPAVQILTDKDQLRSTLENLDIPMPRTIPVIEPEDLDVVADEEITSFFLKPRDSQSFSQRFRRKAFSVESRGDALARLAEMQQEGFDAVFQEYVIGPMNAHYFIDGFVDRKGSIKALFARQRLFMFPTDFGNSSLMVSVPLADVAPAVDSLRVLLPHLEHRGVFSAEFKQDEGDGLFKLLEVNVRPWWFVDFAAMSGVDVCTMAYRDALNLDVDPVFDYEPGRRHMMFTQHLRALLKLRPEKKLGFREWLKSWWGASDAVFRLADPLPGLALLVQSLSRFSRTREQIAGGVRSAPGR